MTQTQTWGIVTHSKFHEDEVAAIVLLVLYGQEKYPGIDRAGIQLVGNPRTIDGEKLFREEHKICIGCGGHTYDEHGRKRDSRCAAELVGTDLGVEGDPVLGKVLKKVLAWVNHRDTTADVRPTELSSLIKMWHRIHPDNPQMVLDRALDATLDWVEDEARFQRVYQSLKLQRKRFQIKDSSQLVTYALISEDNPYGAKAARYKGVDLVINHNPRTGNVQVFTSSAARLDISLAVGLIRQAEALKRGVSLKNWPREQLCTDELIPVLPQWYYLRAGQMLLNGSDQSSPGVEATAVPIEDIEQAIRVGTRSRPEFNGSSGK